MSHIRDSPEFRLARSDSKDPATTCRGLTADGRRCRRTVALKSLSTKSGNPVKDGSLKSVAVTEVFCWQHKDQASEVSVKAKEPAKALKGRSSLDTLVERTGILTVDDEPTARKGARQTKIQNNDRRQKDTFHAQRHSADIAYRPPPGASPGGPEPRNSSAKKRSGSERFLCFILNVDKDDVQDMKNRRRSENIRPASTNSPRVARTPPGYRSEARNGRTLHPSSAHSSPGMSPSHGSSQPSGRPAPSPLQSTQSNSLRPSSAGAACPKSSNTQFLLSWIPPSLSPETTSKLLQKLAEPLSSSEESGYIYIYCVTPPSSTPTTEAASLLIPPPPGASGHGRRTSDVLQSAGIPANKTRDPTRNQTTKTITLKIGRAVNVSRRLTQQCAHNLTLVRYYPYRPSAPGAPLPRKVPNIHRLERLIHIELGDMRFKLEDPCEQCGKKHQEYFEIEASKEQLQLVDGCIRRWVRFSELNP